MLGAMDAFGSRRLRWECAVALVPIRVIVLRYANPENSIVLRPQHNYSFERPSTVSL